MRNAAVTCLKILIATI